MSANYYGTRNSKAKKRQGKGFVVPCLWFCCILSVAFTFYLQVTFNNLNMALLPYLFLGAILTLTAFDFAPSALRLLLHPSRPIDLLILCYIALLAGKLFVLGFWGIAVSEISRNAFLYVFPLVAYFLLATTRNDRIVRSLFYALAVSGLIAGGFFAYESYSKLVLQQIPEFQFAAFQYSVQRLLDTSGNEMTNYARIHPEMRAQGLMASHRATATWVAVGTFAAFALLGNKRSSNLQIIVPGIGFLLLLAGLNFTSLIAYTLTYLLIVTDGAFRPRTGRAIYSRIALATLVSATVLIVTLLAAFVAEVPFAQKIIGSLSSQFVFIFFTPDFLDTKVKLHREL